VKYRIITLPVVKSGDWEWLILQDENPDRYRYTPRKYELNGEEWWTAPEPGRYSPREWVGVSPFRWWAHQTAVRRLNRHLKYEAAKQRRQKQREEELKRWGK
jgi:hypothetical protein